jgi:hypothetical protein
MWSVEDTKLKMDSLNPNRRIDKARRRIRALAVGTIVVIGAMIYWFML